MRKIGIIDSPILIENSPIHVAFDLKNGEIFFVSKNLKELIDNIFLEDSSIIEETGIATIPKADKSFFGKPISDFITFL